MPEVVLQRFNAVEEASTVYGNQFLDEIVPASKSGAWDVRSRFLSGVGRQDTEAVSGGFTDEEGLFTQPDLLDTEERQVQQLIRRIRIDNSIPYQERMYNRLLSLFYDAKEDDPASIGIAIESLRNFYNFLQLHTNLKYPTISLTPDYNIYASWRSGRNLFSVHFLSNSDVRFVIFKPNKKHAERQVRISGKTTNDFLIEDAMTFGLEGWILE